MDQLLAGRYRLENKIASGGMGTVWRAYDDVLQRPVAIKVLNEQLAEDAQSIERFRREAMTAAQLSHPNMANVYDFVEHDGRPGIVMELVEGETLAQRLARGRLAPADAALIIDATLHALAAAHHAGIVHRDIKPGNILLTPRGDVKVTDFGIARAFGDSTLTMTGTVMGTAHYASPEQVKGEPVTPQADLYGTGVVLFEMLAGTRPFDAESQIAVALARLTTDAPSVRSLNLDVPESLDAVVARALERDPAARFSNAEEMSRALRAAVGLGPGTAPFVAAASPVATTAMSMDSAPTTAIPGRVPPVGHRRREHIPRGARRMTTLALVPALVVALLAWALVGWVAGPSQAEVPDFVGMKRADAVAEADRLGLELAFRERERLEPKGEVFRQSVDEGTLVSPGARVVVYVSSGCCTVPPLFGETVEQAQALLRQAHLDAASATVVYTDAYEAGTVISQDPAAGELVEPGAAVNIEFAAPPPEPEEKGPGHGKGRKGDRDDDDDD